MKAKKTLLTTILALALLGGSGAVAEASAPEPGGRLLYLEFPTTTLDPGRLMSAQPNGQGVQDLGKNLTWYAGPDYSPDGTKIVYANGWSGAPGGKRIATVTNTPDQYESSPVWSPDGRWIAYGSGATGSDEFGNPHTVAPVVHLMTRTGGNQHATSLAGVPTSWRR